VGSYIEKDIEFSEVLDALFLYYGVFTIVELADKMGLESVYISNLKTRGSVNPLRKKCMDLGIYKDIFEKSDDKKPNTTILSPEEALILKKYKEASEDGVEDQFLIYMLNFKYKIKKTC
jgi:hypothetical protein